MPRAVLLRGEDKNATGIVLYPRSKRMNGGIRFVLSVTAKSLVNCHRLYKKLLY